MKWWQLTLLSAKVDAFLKAIAELSEQYGLSLSHEDGQGAFIIESYCESNINWLKDAFINVDLGDLVWEEDEDDVLSEIR